MTTASLVVLFQTAPPGAARPCATDYTMPLPPLRLNFGKYQDKPLSLIPVSYLWWALRETRDDRIRRAIGEELIEHLAKFCKIDLADYLKCKAEVDALPDEPPVTYQMGKP
jgi:uncharacterized protein (DUF3820 family)